MCVKLLLSMIARFNLSLSYWLPKDFARNSIDCSSKKVTLLRQRNATYLSFHFSNESQKSLQRRFFGLKFLNGIRFSFLNPLNNLTPCGDVVKFLWTLQRSHPRIGILSHTEDYVVSSGYLGRPQRHLIKLWFLRCHEIFL